MQCQEETDSTGPEALRVCHRPFPSPPSVPATTTSSPGLLTFVIGQLYPRFADADDAETVRADLPPSSPDTSHVPCKFFRQGACQAGNACPFSHDLGSAAETVCKYFAKVRSWGFPLLASFRVSSDRSAVTPTPS